MNLLIELCFLFFIGSVSGWVAELFYRRFFSDANPGRKWINPGFCTGPYLPLYGVGLGLVYLITVFGKRHLPSDSYGSDLFLIVCMSIAMTVVEYIAGILALKVVKVRLWDYRKRRGNIQGIICPMFSLIWAGGSAIYYFFLHPLIERNLLQRLVGNDAAIFALGLFFGVFIVDVAHSVRLIEKLRRFANENDVIVKFENIKAQIRLHHEETAQKYHFFRPFSSDKLLAEHLKEMLESFETRRRDDLEKIRNRKEKR